MTIKVLEPTDAEAENALPWNVFWIASMAVFLVSIDTTVLYAAFTRILQSFPNSTAASVSWVLNSYTIVYATMLIPSGGIADKFGRKKVFMIGVSLFLLASLACGLAPSVGWLIAARTLQAIGASLLTPASLSLILEAFPQSKRAIVVSAWGAVGALAAALGPGLGSLIIDTAGWPWAFFINIPIGLICLWRGIRLLHESKNPRVDIRFDLPGMLLIILAIGSITLAIVEFNSKNFQRYELIGLVVFGIIMMSGFIQWARHAANPLIDLKLFNNKTYRFVNIAAFTYAIAFSMMFFAFFFYMTSIWHYSLPRAGIAITPGPLTVIPFAIVSGRIASKIGHRSLLITGCIIYALSGLWFLIVPDETVSYAAHWLPGLIMSGMSVGMVMPSLSGAAVHGLPPKDYAIGSAINQAIRQIGAVVGVACTILLLGHAAIQLSDFKWIYSCHIALALLTALLVIPVNTRPKAK
jgi:EmrB/QacA subfamily drug resistance transporter